MTQRSLFDSNKAAFSECRTYRYALYRHWRNGGKIVQFIGLNPSTADETHDDPTLRRCINFARDWGFDGLCMTNLFAYRLTDSSKLKAVENPVGEDNDQWLDVVAEEAALIVACWGPKGVLMKRDTAIKRMLEGRLHSIRKTSGGHPEHPLYLPKILTPEIFI